MSNWGCNKEYPIYGYNREGKKQIVIGLLTDQNGYPVSVEVFTGNEREPNTVLNQINKLSNRFQTDNVILVEIEA